MKTVTYVEFLECAPYWVGVKEVEQIKAYFDRFGGKMSVLDILNLDCVSAEVKLWSVLCEEFIPEPILHEFACVCAEYALTLIDNPDPRSIKAVEVKRAWMRGEASDEELAAASDAASDAYWAACDAYDAACAACTTCVSCDVACDADAACAACYACDAACFASNTDCDVRLAAFAAVDGANAARTAKDATWEALAAYLIMTLEEEK